MEGGRSYDTSHSTWREAGVTILRTVHGRRQELRYFAQYMEGGRSPHSTWREAGVMILHTVHGGRQEFA